MKRLISNLIKGVIKKYFYIIGLLTNKQYILFVPHPGMCKVDLYDIINYKSDSALTFLRYILDNKLLSSKKIIVAVRDDSSKERYNRFVAEHYPDRSICFSPIHTNKQYSLLQQLARFIEFCSLTSKCSHIFASITYDFSGLISSQVVVDLNYFTCGMKNDILDKSNPHYMGVEKVGREFKFIIGTSELAIRLIMPEMTVPYKRYVNLGLCRNDNLLNGDKCEWLRKEFVARVSYDVKTVVLYTPTHRDYESKMTGNVTRSILGFEYDPIDFEQFLKKNGIIFICKLHPKQNALVVENELPEGIILHKASERYGLTELMQLSDVLVTDYTSAYFDYLLLDKPIIFNFYDLEVYKRERGVPFEPMSAISAGDIVNNELEMKDALFNLERNKKQYSQMRTFVRNLFFTNQDALSCKRIYDFVFQK